jgi:hypothetical protein
MVGRHLGLGSHNSLVQNKPMKSGRPYSFPIHPQLLLWDILPVYANNIPTIKWTLIDNLRAIVKLAQTVKDRKAQSMACTSGY